jgi:hypothetical protein
MSEGLTIDQLAEITDASGADWLLGAKSGVGKARKISISNAILRGPVGATGPTGPAGPTGPSGAINSDITAIVTLTQAAYNALSPKVATTLYIITP